MPILNFDVPAGAGEVRMSPAFGLTPQQVPHVAVGQGSIKCVGFRCQCGPASVHRGGDPDLFEAAAERLGVDIATAVVVGDSVWDLLAAKRARALGIGLLSGGYGQTELEQAGAYRVYQDPYDLLQHLDEVGVRAAA